MKNDRKDFSNGSYIDEEWENIFKKNNTAKGFASNNYGNDNNTWSVNNYSGNNTWSANSNTNYSPSHRANAKQFDNGLGGKTVKQGYGRNVSSLRDNNLRSNTRGNNTQNNYNNYNSRKKSNYRRKKIKKLPCLILLLAIVLIIVLICSIAGNNSKEEFAEKYPGMKPMYLPTYGERFWDDQLYIGEDILHGSDKIVVIPKSEYDAYCSQMGGEDKLEKIMYIKSVAKGETELDYMKQGSVFSVETDQKLIALSFDDGPNPDTIDQYLKILADHNATATFFMLGQYMEANPEAVDKIVESGNEPATHTWSHKNFKKCSANVISDDLHKSADTFRRLVGYDPYLMRCPYGNITDDVKALNKEMGMLSAMWNIDTLDWKKDNPEQVVNSVKANACAGSIILMHEGKSVDLQALPLILDYLNSQGYKVVSVGELIWQTNEQN